MFTIAPFASLLRMHVFPPKKKGRTRRLRQRHLLHLKNNTTQPVEREKSKPCEEEWTRTALASARCFSPPSKRAQFFLYGRDLSLCFCVLQSFEYFFELAVFRNWSYEEKKQRKRAPSLPGLCEKDIFSFALYRRGNILFFIHIPPLLFRSLKRRLPSPMSQPPMEGVKRSYTMESWDGESSNETTEETAQEDSPHGSFRKIIVDAGATASAPPPHRCFSSFVSPCSDGRRGCALRVSCGCPQGGGRPERTSATVEDFGLPEEREAEPAPDIESYAHATCTRARVATPYLFLLWSFLWSALIIVSAMALVEGATGTHEALYAAAATDGGAVPVRTGQTSEGWRKRAYEAATVSVGFHTASLIIFIVLEVRRCVGEPSASKCRKR